MEKETAGCPRHTFFSMTLVKPGNTVLLFATSLIVLLLRHNLYIYLYIYQLITINMSSNVLLLFFDGKCKYLMGEVFVWV